MSNFGIGHLEQLLIYATVSPAVNQIELSPFLQRTELVDYCRSKDIVLEVRTPYCCSFQDTWMITHAIRVLQVSVLCMQFNKPMVCICLSIRSCCIHSWDSCCYSACLKVSCHAGILPTV